MVGHFLQGSLRTEIGIRDQARGTMSRVISQECSSIVKVLSQFAITGNMVWRRRMPEDSTDLTHGRITSFSSSQ